MGLEISDYISIPDEEIRFRAIRAQGAGGQNVNKVSTAIHLRFDVQSSSLPERCKQKLLALSDQRLNADGTDCDQSTALPEPGKKQGGCACAPGRADQGCRQSRETPETNKAHPRAASNAGWTRKPGVENSKTQRGRIDY